MTKVDKKQALPSSKTTDENSLVEWAKTIGVSLLLAFGIRTFVAEARYIPSESMMPTLQVNDRLIIDKVTYEFRDPQRGNCGVSTDAGVAGAGFRDAFIKRIIGLPGSRCR